MSAVEKTLVLVNRMVLKNIFVVKSSPVLKEKAWKLKLLKLIQDSGRIGKETLCRT